MGLAYEQGFLTTKDSSPIQRWALAYKIAQERKFSLDQQRAESKRFAQLSQDILWIMNPQLHSQINSKEDDPFESDEIMSTDELDSIEGFLNKLNRGDTISASDLSTPGEWV